MNDAEATNLLEINRPEDPKCQVITIDTFRQIRLTLDNYLSKRAWSTENAFSQFNSVMQGWIAETKNIYESTTYNSFIGTHETDTGLQTQTIAAVADQSDALTIAEYLANLLVKVKDISRDYNDYQFLRSYSEGDLQVVWNASFYNKIRKLDLPTIFNNEGLLSEFTQEVLPERYFGTPVAATTVPSDGGIYRSLKEQVAGGKHYFAGEAIPAGTTVEANSTYKEDNTIAFKVIHKQSVPYMSAFSTATSFFNPRSLTETHYLTFGHNTLQALSDKPFITVRFTE